MIYTRMTIFLIFLALSTHAKLQLVEWHNEEWKKPFILPVKDNESPKAVAARYLKMVEKTPELAELLWDKRVELESSHFYPLDTKASKVLLLANRAQDYSRNSERVNNLSHTLQKSNDASYLLPVAVARILSSKEQQDFYDLISEKFPIVFSLGGDDVTPEFYKSENFHSRPQSVIRDQYEINFIRNYYRRGKGFIFGICRGAQLTAIALGYKLIQDIPFHISNPMSHQNDSHPINYLKTRNQILSKAVGSEVKAKVRSIHHQSVLFHQGGPLEISAMSDDGVIEALEAKNGRVLLVQFHPELMTEKVGENIILGAIQQFKVLHQNPRSCLRNYL